MKAVKHKELGLTVIEILTVVGIIALLVGMLIPTLNVVRNIAKETKQKAQLTTIELALVTFKNDYGDYPWSDPYSHDTNVNDYCGSQKLAEALLGRDLLGFHPESTWSATDLSWYPPEPSEDNIRKRKGPYLELATANVFRLGSPEGLFVDTAMLIPGRFVLCDVFGAKKVTVIKPVTLEPVTYTAGTPILYFKANTSSKRIEPPPPYIYDLQDNIELINLGRVKDTRSHQLNTLSQFINYIMDPKASTPTRAWPYRPDSYLLISAGLDGFYGTEDDIRNFGN